MRAGWPVLFDGCAGLAGPAVSTEVLLERRLHTDACRRMTVAPASRQHLKCPPANQSSPPCAPATRIRPSSPDLHGACRPVRPPNPVYGAWVALNLDQPMKLPVSNWAKLLAALNGLERIKRAALVLAVAGPVSSLFPSSCHNKVAASLAVFPTSSPSFSLLLEQTILKRSNRRYTN
jgi:hypothetical protein